MSGEMWLPTRCGDGKLSGDGGAEAEYPCVRRYRHRRLLTFLWLQGFRATPWWIACLLVVRLGSLMSLRARVQDAERVGRHHVGAAAEAVGAA